MLIELTEDVMVRVPDERLPFGAKSGVFHTFKAGSKGNYSSENRDGTHMVHRFSCSTAKYGILTHICVTELRDRPNWL